jgi:nitric oxide reductase NorE protein
VFIYAELAAFAAFFAAYAFTRAQHLALFNQMQRTLNPSLGALNTALLISASYFVAQAVATTRDATKANRGANWLLAALLCGAGFVVVKLFEYHDKFSEGIRLSTNTFYMFYLSLTFFHFMHVVLGLIILSAIWRKARRGGYSANDCHGLETGASYWHMVDSVWIILFPLVYVMH